MRLSVRCLRQHPAESLAVRLGLGTVSRASVREADALDGTTVLEPHATTQRDEPRPFATTLSDNDASPPETSAVVPSRRATQ